MINELENLSVYVLNHSLWSAIRAFHKINRW